MRYGYIRVTKASPSLEHQRAALTGAGVKNARIMVDPLRERRLQADEKPAGRERVIAKLEAGDELVVMSAARLGNSADDLVFALARIARAGAAMVDLSADVTLRPDTGFLAAVETVERALAEGGAEIAAKMRARKDEIGVHSGPAPKLAGDVLERAREMWADPSLHPDQIAVAAGVTARTLYRKFGRRDH